MAKQDEIRTLKAAGWSQRRIAKHLGINRRTVSLYLKKAKKTPNSNCAKVTAGSEVENHEKQDSLPHADPVTSASRSHCEPFRNVITQGVEKGQCADLIWRDLRADHGFTHSYQSVKRFVRKLKEGSAVIEPVQRLECLPGEEAQVDFGFARTIRNDNDRLVQSNVLRVTLSFSRKGRERCEIRKKQRFERKRIQVDQ